MKSPQRSTFVMTIPPQVCFGYAVPRRRQGWLQAVVRPAHPPNLVATIQVYGGGRASVYRGHDVRFGSKADIGYSINSSARSCSSREIVIPSAFAVLRLITSSYLVGA